MTTFWILLVLTILAAGYGLYVVFPEIFGKDEAGGKQRFWGVLFGTVLAAEALLFVVAPILHWWLPKAASTYAPDIDLLFYVILAVVGVTFVAVSAVLVYVLLKYPSEPGRRALYTHGNHKLEMLWTAAPAALLLVLAVAQIPAWLKVKNMGWLKDTLDGTADTEFVQVEVMARQWEWRMRYASSEHTKEWADSKAAVRDFRLKMPPRPDDVRTVTELHVIKGQKAVIHLRTGDVIHSFFLPQMRLKQDALPGKTIPVWFEPTEANCEKIDGAWADGRRYNPAKNKWEADKNYVWELACAEYCGSRHSMMRAKLFVHATKDDYLDWLRSVEQQNAVPAPAPAGR